MTVFSSDRVGAVIVAGGRASRFGSDKLAVEVEFGKCGNRVRH